MGVSLSKYNLINDNSFSNSMIIKINSNWYDVTKFSNQHPGGTKVLKYWHLRDATNNFNKLECHKFTQDILSKYKITDDILIDKLNKFSIIE
jgi:cytochrome b involved in lipid metabolism